MEADPFIADVRRAMESQKRSQADVGRLLGLDSASVTRTFQGKRRLQRYEAETLRDWLGLAGAAAGAQIFPGPGMVPLFGWVGASTNGNHVMAEQQVLGNVPRHPNQMHLRDAFALRVADVSMSPRYEPGEIVYLAPNQWPAREQDCVLVTRQGHGYLKRYVGRSPTALQLRQLNPDEGLEFQIVDVEAMHAVVGRG